MNPIAEWTRPGRIIGSRVLVYDTVSSTNDLAVSHPPGTAIIARHQTAGRGQYGRTWTSQPGDSLLMSVVVPPNEAFTRPTTLIAWVAVAVAELVDRLTGRVSQLKWPNDVLVDGKKIAGILIERGKTIVVGIGLNVNQTAVTLAAAGLTDATSLAIEKRCQEPFSLDCVAEELLVGLDVGVLAELGEIEDRWRTRMG